MGKTSVTLKVAKSIKIAGYGIGGMVSREVKVGGTRIGFELEDLHSLKKGWLAHKDRIYGPRLGKYVVNVDDLDNIGVEAIRNASNNPKINLIVIDEIGPMELYSKNFVKAVLEAINCNKPLLGTIHFKLKHFLIEDIKSMNQAIIIPITIENRDRIGDDISLKIQKIIYSLNSGSYQM